MKTIFVALLLSVSVSAVAGKNVSGYMRKDGTYVQPHQRSNPNGFRYDNYSSRGNSNPYTGQRGSGRNEFSNPPAYNQLNGHKNQARKFRNW